VKTFDELLSSHFSPVETCAKACGSDVEAIVAAFKDAALENRKLLSMASKCKKPADQATLEKAVGPLMAAMQKVDTLKDRRSKSFNHLAMVAEGAACFQWVCVENTPAPFLGDIIPGSEMYCNKILMEFKGKDEQQTAFAKSFKAFLLELQKYIKAEHTTGLMWNPSGGTDYSSGAAPPSATPAAPQPPAGGPPPPPPPPPAGFFDELKKAPAPSTGGGGAAAVFAELNALGEKGVTGNLRKVMKEEMTHKNPGLRQSSVVANKPKPGGAAASGPKAAPAKKPPRKEQAGNKWFFENCDNDREMAVEGNPKTAVCMVQCKNSLLQVKGKVNTVQIDGCVKSSVVVDACVASVDIINCKSVEVQVTDWSPMITMDGCSGVIVYLSQRCVDEDVAIVSSKCSELNVVLPPKKEEDDPVEIPIPEQFETRVVNGQLVTTPVAHVGA